MEQLQSAVLRHCSAVRRVRLLVLQDGMLGPWPNDVRFTPKTNLSALMRSQETNGMPQVQVKCTRSKMNEMLETSSLETKRSAAPSFRG